MQKALLIDQLNIHYPIFQAPMGGVTTPKLVAAVSNYGGLGNIGAGYLNKVDTRRFINDVKALTNKPFGINVFVPKNEDISDNQIKTAFTLMNDHLKKLDQQENTMPDYESIIQHENQIEVILNEHVPVCSFTFGIPGEDIINELKKRDIFLIGTATTVKEAQLVEEAKLDAVVIQGSEAGGHRGTFYREEQLIGTMALLPQVVDHVSIPVIAAGGIMDGRGLMASISLGAQAAQLGTAFLTTKECGTNSVYKEALLNATEEDTTLTSAFSGKTARGLQNEFIQAMTPYESELPPFPYQNAFTRQIRKVAAEQHNEQYMSLWSGQAPRLTKDLAAKDLLNKIIKQYEDVRKKLTSL